MDRDTETNRQRDRKTGEQKTGRKRVKGGESVGGEWC